MAKFSNMLKMLFLLQKNEKMTIKELAEELEVSEKQVRRYKTELEISGIYIKSLPGVNGGYYLENKMDIPINLNVKDNLKYLKYFDEKTRDKLALELVSENTYQIDKLVKYLSRDTADKIIYHTLLDDDFARNIFVDEFLNIADCVSSIVADKLAIKMLTQGCKEYEILYPYIINKDIKRKLIDLMIYNEKVDNISTVYSDINENQLYKFSKILINNNHEKLLIKNKEYIKKVDYLKIIYKKVFLNINMYLASITLFIMMFLSTFVLVFLMSRNHLINNIPKNILIARNVYPTVEQLNDLERIYGDNLTFELYNHYFSLDIQNEKNGLNVGVVPTNSYFIEHNIYETDLYGYVSKYDTGNDNIELIEGKVWDNGTDRNVVVIDTEVKKSFKIVGLNKEEYIRINDLDYLIIGIVDDGNGINKVFMPSRTYYKNFSDYKYYTFNPLIKIVKDENITKEDVKNIENIRGVQEIEGEYFNIKSYITPNITTSIIRIIIIVVTLINLAMLSIYILSLVMFIKRKNKLFKHYTMLYNEVYNRRKVFSLFVFISGVIFGILSYIINLKISNNYYSYRAAYNIYYPSFITLGNLLLISLVNVSIIFISTFLTYRLTRNEI